MINLAFKSQTIFCSILNKIKESIQSSHASQKKNNKMQNPFTIKLSISSYQQAMNKKNSQILKGILKKSTANIKITCDKLNTFSLSICSK